MPVEVVVSDRKDAAYLSAKVKVWRYLDVTRLALLLSDKEIYFSRLGFLADVGDHRPPSDTVR